MKQAPLVKEEFYRLHPNASRAIHRTTLAMKKAIIRYKKNKQQATENKIPPPTPEEAARFKEWKSKRVKKSFYDFPEELQVEITKAVAAYTFKHKVDRIYLSGSYASGSWVDKNTTEEEREIRAKIKKMKDVSDVDLIPYPYVEPFRYKSVEFTDTPNGNRFLIWERKSDEGRFV